MQSATEAWKVTLEQRIKIPTGVQSATRAAQLKGNATAQITLYGLEAEPTKIIIAKLKELGYGVLIISNGPYYTVSWKGEVPLPANPYR